MPENAYFRQPDTQKMLLDILFVWCKLNPHIGYRQGMHEVLAPFVWVVERDAIAPGKNEQSGDDPILAELLDAEFIEHDCFALFNSVMKTAKSFYQPATQAPGSKEPPADSAMIKRAKGIFEELLIKVDPELAEHLRALDIMPQIFLM